MNVEFNIPIGAELWKKVNYNGQILDRYSVSDYGRVYDHKRNIFLPFQDNYGYYRTSLNVNGEIIQCFVHRIELMSFNPIANFNDMVVNHKDGNKKRNLLSNLEWVTQIENTRHAWDNNLSNCYGLNNGKGKYDDATIHKICSFIDQGLSTPQICDKFNLEFGNNRDKFNSLIYNIKSGFSHRNISEQYNFLPGIKAQKRYSPEFAHLVCNFLSDPNRQYTYKEIMDFLQIPNSDRINFKLYIDSLIYGQTCRNITKLYNIKKPIDGNDEYSYLMN